MVSESYQTSPPAPAAPPKVTPVLAAKAIATPNATGTSMPRRRWRRSRSALAKNGWQLNRTTGSVRIQDAHSSRRAMSALMSPGCATYAGSAYIITCIMEKPATSQRHSIRRAAWRRGPAASTSPAGSAP